ncbi:MAG: hypothetical protein WBB42_06375 [Polyangiales bacterium]
MTLIHTRRLATAGCLAFLICGPASGCSDDAGSAGGTGGTAGGAGMGGEGGMGGSPPLRVPGLWEGQSPAVQACFYISPDGLTLTSNPGCSIAGQGGGQSFALGVDLVGTDGNGQPCSLEIAYDGEITIDQDTDSFRASVTEPPGSGITLSFSGQLVGDRASGLAQRDEGDSFCRVGWAASPTSQCDDAAIDACLDLLNCCMAILINPVFFETCNSVVQQCDKTQCEEVLAGYPQCAPEPEP